MTKYLLLIPALFILILPITVKADRQYGNKTFKEINGTEACQMQYDNQNLYAHTDNWEDPYSWVCRYNTEVGGINVGGIDIYTYCQKKFGLGSHSIGKTAYDWVCGESSCELIVAVKSNTVRRTNLMKIGRAHIPSNNYYTEYIIKLETGKEYTASESRNVGECN